jgi:hypothetical protein
MGRTRFAFSLLLVLSTTSCAFLLDFDEVQSESSGGSSGSSAASAGTAGTAGSAEGGGAGAPEDQGIPLDDAAAVLADALCTKVRSCVDDAAMALLFNEEDCTETITGVLENSTIANIISSDEEGTLSYDGTKLPACLDTYQALSCDDVIIDFPEDCKAALGSSLEEGEACKHSLECEPGLYCAGDACPGACTAFLSEGASCTEGDVCASGLTCFQESCLPLGREDDDCGGGLFPDCVIGQFCAGENLDEAVPGKCYPVEQVFSAGKNQVCHPLGSPPTLCEAGLSCPILNPTCRGPAERDGACEVLAIPDYCPEGQSCREGICTDLPGSGEPCRASTAGKGACQAGFRCVNNVCRKLNDNGASCAEAAECFSSFCSEEGDCSVPCP